ncbi:cupin domain-containing protein [Herbiconiux sp. SYSU D00978]|uniref:cupin domain-containing protein n=1 Tax=Herbiconiux sp. SYSU D00978 TaxID=2812562 RepID=UPI001A973D51|nr:cupin domain-containing protein [Herbiconiux sp. SYSU D00978]
MTAPASTFPGGTSVSLLDVYDTVAPDGVAGGTPHLHLASAEAYVVTAGRGELHTLGPNGVTVTPLEPGVVAWFTPGTIHRAVNLGGLAVVVVMQNSGLPEAGDAVMSFPLEHLADADRYAAVAALPVEATQADADRRRDLAVQGFLSLRTAAEAGDLTPYRRFCDAAVALVQPKAERWRELWSDVVRAQVDVTDTVLADLAQGLGGHLASAALTVRPAERRFGMCGRLRTFDVRG